LEKLLTSIYSAKSFFRIGEGSIRLEENDRNLAFMDEKRTLPPFKLQPAPKSRDSTRIIIIEEETQHS
jgi:hypothetical protein